MVFGDGNPERRTDSAVQWWEMGGNRINGVTLRPRTLWMENIEWRERDRGGGERVCSFLLSGPSVVKSQKHAPVKLQPFVLSTDAVLLCVNVCFWYVPMRMRSAANKESKEWEEELGRVSH